EVLGGDTGNQQHERRGEQSDGDQDAEQGRQAQAEVDGRAASHVACDIAEGEGTEVVSVASRIIAKRKTIPHGPAGERRPTEGASPERGKAGAKAVDALLGWERCAQNKVLDSERVPPDRGLEVACRQFFHRTILA